MKKRKKHLRYLLLSVVLFLFCFQVIKAQPTCSAIFNPYDACNQHIQNKEFVFLGKVISVLNRKRENHADPLKIIVEIERPIKGKLVGRVELLLDQFCFGEIYEKRRYIFTAERVKKEDFSGLFSEKWSELGDEYTENDINEIIQEIRSAINKVKQPRLVGTVVEQSYSKGQYTIASKGVKKLFSPNYLRPLPNIIVTVKRKEGQIFTSSTNVEGEFVFGDLPLGLYEVSTNLPKEYNVMLGGSSLFQKDGKNFLEIRDQICSQRIIFNGQLQGDIQIRFDNALSRWSYIIVHLQRVHELDGKRLIGEFAWDVAKDRFFATEGSGDIGFNYSFKNVPVGNYVLMLRVTTDPSKGDQRVYYPGTFDMEKAAFIKVEAGKTSNIEFSLPDLPER